MRNCIVDATFGYNYLLFVFFFNERQRKRELSKLISRVENMHACFSYIHYNKIAKG